jgi:hypothetical protein
MGICAGPWPLLPPLHRHPCAPDRGHRHPLRHLDGSGLCRHLGDATQLPSLETGIDQPSLLGSCDIGYSCAYQRHFVDEPDRALPVAANPRDVFERLFGDGDAGRQSRMAQLRRQTSMLDSCARMRAPAGNWAWRTGASSTNISPPRATSSGASSAPPPPLADAGSMQRPAGIPDSFDEHVRLMVDLQVLAFRPISPASPPS